MMQRNDGRAPDEIRPINFELNVAPHASGSVLVAMGKTRVICSVAIEDAVPRWMKEQGVIGGWLTAEYSMLPYSTQPRKPRDITKGRIDGRSVEIQRLIGRSGWIAMSCKPMVERAQPRSPARAWRSPSPAENSLGRKNSMHRRCKSWLPQ
jgi:ribonuclease PH